MDLHLKGKRALILGSSRGLGFATALGLAREGCHITINGRDSNKLEQAEKILGNEADTQIISIAGDVTDSSTPQRVIAQTAESLGGLDLLVTNAGGPPSGSFETFKDETWDKSIDLSLTA